MSWREEARSGDHAGAGRGAEPREQLLLRAKKLPSAGPPPVGYHFALLHDPLLAKADRPCLSESTPASVHQGKNWYRFDGQEADGSLVSVRDPRLRLGGGARVRRNAPADLKLTRFKVSLAACSRARALVCPYRCRVLPVPTNYARLP